MIEIGGGAGVVATVKPLTVGIGPLMIPAALRIMSKLSLAE